MHPLATNTLNKSLILSKSLLSTGESEPVLILEFCSNLWLIPRASASTFR